MYGVNRPIAIITFLLTLSFLCFGKQIRIVEREHFAKKELLKVALMYPSNIESLLQREFELRSLVTHHKFLKEFRNTNITSHNFSSLVTAEKKLKKLITREKRLHDFLIKLGIDTSFYPGKPALIENVVLLTEKLQITKAFSLQYHREFDELMSVKNSWTSKNGAFVELKDEVKSYLDRRKEKFWNATARFPSLVEEINSHLGVFLDNVLADEKLRLKSLEFFREYLDKLFSPQFREIPGTNIAIMTKELTQWLWLTIMGENPSFFSTRESCSDFIKVNKKKLCPENPVERVSFQDIQQYIKKLNTFLGNKNCVENDSKVNIKGCYRLPSAEEWQIAAMGDSNVSGQITPPGQSAEWLLWKHAWVHCNSSSGPAKHTHPVGLKKSNSYGLFDMIGNVSEWTHGIHYPIDKAGNRIKNGNAFHLIKGMSANTRVYEFWVTEKLMYKNTKTYCNVNYNRDSEDSRFLGFRLAKVSK